MGDDAGAGDRAGAPARRIRAGTDSDANPRRAMADADAPITAPVPFDRERIARLQASFARLRALRGTPAVALYQELFTLHPTLRRLFGTDIERQAARLLDAVERLLTALSRPAMLEAMLQRLGAAHLGYGVVQENYDQLREALVAILARIPERELDAATRADWLAVYDHLAAEMIAAEDRLRRSLVRAIGGLH